MAISVTAATTYAWRVAVREVSHVRGAVSEALDHGQGALGFELLEVGLHLDR
jgi:hypothetical protein